MAYQIAPLSITLNHLKNPVFKVRQLFDAEYIRIAKDTAIVNTKCEYETVPKLSNNTIFNKKYVLSNSESVQCNFFHFWSRDVHPIQNMLLWTKCHQNRMIFHLDMAI